MTDAHVRSSGGAPVAGPLVSALAENWWVILLRGIAALIFGILALVWPGITTIALTYIVAAYLIVDGALSLWAGISGGGWRSTPRWWLIIVGLAGLIAGIAGFIWPVAMSLALLLYIAVWAIVAGVSMIVGAIALRREIEGEWLLILAGILTALFGVFLIVQPAAGVLALVWTIGVYAIIMAFVEFGLAFKLRKYKAT